MLRSVFIIYLEEEALTPVYSHDSGDVESTTWLVLVGQFKSDKPRSCSVSMLCLSRTLYGSVLEVTVKGNR